MSRKKSKFKYYPEEVLIDLVQRGLFSWVDYVEHYSPALGEEFNEFLAQRGMSKNNSNALAYISFKEDILQEAMAQGCA